MSEHSYYERLEYLTSKGVEMNSAQAVAYIEMQVLRQQAITLAESARRLGFVLTIAQVPQLPLSMGHHYDNVQVTFAHERYRNEELCPRN